MLSSRTVAILSLTGVGAILIPIVLKRMLARVFRRGLSAHFPNSHLKTIKRSDPRENDVLYVYMPDLRPWGYPNASPFSSKLECFLRMAKIPFVVIRGMDLSHAPKGKVPYIEWNGMLMGDSQLIIQFLCEKFPDNPMTDTHLSPSDRAVALAFNRMICEHLSFCLGYTRNYEHFDQSLQAYGAGNLPWLMKTLLTRRIRNGTIEKLKAQGLGRHSRDEIYAIGRENLKAISDFLGDKKYLMGDRPSQVDASAFGILSSILWVPMDNPLKEYAQRECRNLHELLLRIRDNFFDDTLEPWYTGGDY